MSIKLTIINILLDPVEIQLGTIELFDRFSAYACPVTSPSKPDPGPLKPDFTSLTLFNNAEAESQLGKNWRPKNDGMCENDLRDITLDNQTLCYKKWVKRGF